MYKIKYFYQTGDSFHTEDMEDILEYEWLDLNIAKECLKRIKEHYKWYESLENTFNDPIAKPVWHNVKKGRYLGNEHCLINLPLDNGKEIQFWSPWCGYFERLYGAEIVEEGDTDMKFEL